MSQFVNNENILRGNDNVPVASNDNIRNATELLSKTSDTATSLVHESLTRMFDMANETDTMNNNSSLFDTASPAGTLYHVTPGFVTLLSILYGTISVMTIIGNALIILVIINNRAMHTVTNFFIANLSVADVIIGLFSIPFQFQVTVLMIILSISGLVLFGQL